MVGLVVILCLSIYEAKMVKLVWNSTEPNSIQPNNPFSSIPGTKLRRTFCHAICQIKFLLLVKTSMHHTNSIIRRAIFAASRTNAACHHTLSHGMAPISIEAVCIFYMCFFYLDGSNSKLVPSNHMEFVFNSALELHILALYIFTMELEYSSLIIVMP